jgi:hypothetical protein
METPLAEQQAAGRAVEVEFWKNKIREANQAFAASLSSKVLEHKKQLVDLFDTIEIQAGPEMYYEVVPTPQQVAEQILRDVLDRLGEAPVPEPVKNPVEEHERMSLDQHFGDSDLSDGDGGEDASQGQAPDETASGPKTHDVAKSQPAATSTATACSATAGMSSTKMEHISI